MILSLNNINNNCYQVNLDPTSFWGNLIKKCRNLRFLRRPDGDGRNRSDDLERKKCHQDVRCFDRKYGRKRRGESVEQHNDSRYQGDRQHYGRGREKNSVVRGRSSERGHSRERSRDQFSGKEREDRLDHRGHHKEVCFVSLNTSNLNSLVKLFSFTGFRILSSSVFYAIILSLRDYMFHFMKSERWSATLFLTLLERLETV